VEESLRASEQRARLVVDRALDAFVALDGTGTITDWNPEAERTFGWTRGDVLGRSLASIIVPARLREGFLAGAALPEAGPARNRRVEILALHRDGHEFSVEISLSVIPGTPPTFNAFIRDITERKQAEEALRETTARLTRANAELQAFSYSVSHDLRAPLRAMQGFSVALLEDYADRLDEDGQAFTRRIAGAAERMDRLIQDILDYSRLTTKDVHLARVDLQALLDRLREQMAAEIASQGAEVSVIGPLPAVLAQETILSQVVENLLSNALKFVAPGVAPRVRVWAEARAGRHRVWVEDNGIGVAPEHQERIFQVFERLHGEETYSGTGIGLAIVRRAVERMGGTVVLESTPGVGSRFGFELNAPGDGR
jgi:PAS domain S-box-containing protein